MALGPMRVVSEGELQKKDAQEAFDAAGEASEEAVDTLAGYIGDRFYDFRDHRRSQNLDERYLNALRTYNGEYSPTKLREIKQFGGSEVFSRITSVKCRGATSMLRDIFLSTEQPWHIAPTPVPDLPEDVNSSIQELVDTEVQSMQQRGVAIDKDAITQRIAQLKDAAYRAGIKTAKDAAKKSERKLQDVLVQGGFYNALHEFLIDLPIFPFACIKGPFVQMARENEWVNGEIIATSEPKLCWKRVSCFDLYLDPGASDIKDGPVIEKIRLSRVDLNNLIGVPGYDEEAIREVLQDYGMGFKDWVSDMDPARATEEGREDPYLNTSELIDCLAWSGPVQGKLLLGHGFTKKQIKDSDMDYWVNAWIIGKHTIKAHIDPNPSQRPQYFISSYEVVPGSPIGHGVVEIIDDIQAVANASLRSLVNNLSISSGPQVAIIEDRLHPATDPDSLYPWKRWRFTSDPMGSNATPITFFQPQSNAQELLSVYSSMTQIADEVSAIPRYATGENVKGGAAGTASGMAMLMGNATKVLQSVAAHIDKNVMEPALGMLYDMMMLTDTEGYFTGDENIQVRGVTLAMQKETDRMRRLEFLQIITNPMDAEIVGPEGRAQLLRSLSQDLGLPEVDIVPTNEEIKAKVQQRQMAEQAAQAQGNQASAPGGAGRVSQPMDNMHNTAVQ